MTLVGTLTDRAAGFLERTTNRRGFVGRTAVVGSALTVAGTDFVLRPGTAYAAVCQCRNLQCDCADLCCDGYTEFCCQLYGDNECPPGTLLAGWWKVDNSQFCNGAARYYMDCNDECGSCACGSNGVCSGSCSGAACQCRECGYRKDGCTHFRYGNCNNQVACVGPIMCRVVTCTEPWQLEPTCSSAFPRTDNNTRFHTRPCAEGPDGFTQSVRAFVRSLYRSFLGREGDEGGVEYWTDFVVRGRGRDEVADAFATSEEWVGHVIDDIYEATLGRPADPDGRTYWISRVKAGMTPAAVAALFFASEEFFAASDHRVGRFVERLYEEILGRASTGDERDYWVGVIEGGMSRQTVAAEFYASLESRRRRVADLYRDLLGRDPDPEGWAYWADVLVDGRDLRLARFLAASDEYFARAQQLPQQPSAPDDDSADESLGGLFR